MMLNKYKLYMKAFCNTLKQYKEAEKENLELDLKPFIKKLITYGVKCVNTKERPKYIEIEEAESDFEFADVVMTMIANLTPKEFMELFPIAKDYNGHKYEIKDYFYTRDYIKTLDKDKSIGGEVFDFIWEYHNWEITRFYVEFTGYMSRLRRLEGQPSLFEEFVANEGLKTYTMHTDHNGTKFMIDSENGKTVKLNKNRPCYLKILK